MSAATKLPAAQPGDGSRDGGSSGPSRMEGKPTAATATVAPGGGTRSKPIHYPFWFGGSASSMAACVTHPLDLVKVRLQMRSGDMPKSMTGTFVHVVRADGLGGLYRGLSASLLRQITYSTTRFGIYEELKGRATTTTTIHHADGTTTTRAVPPSLPVLIALASASGFVGGIAGNAADVLNVRMQHDAALPAHARRNYAHAFDGLWRMAREEGLLRSWFRGVWPNSLRAAAMTASQLASYDACKRLLVLHTPLHDDMIATHFAASFLAGVVAATVTSPIDVIKTRVMSASGHSSVPKLLAEIYAAEGVRWMFKGWVPSFLRLGPQTICTFLFLETHRQIYRNMKGIEDPASQ